MSVPDSLSLHGDLVFFLDCFDEGFFKISFLLTPSFSESDLFKSLSLSIMSNSSFSAVSFDIRLLGTWGFRLLLSFLKQDNLDSFSIIFILSEYRTKNLSSQRWDLNSDRWSWRQGRWTLSPPRPSEEDRTDLNLKFYSRKLGWQIKELSRAIDVVEIPAILKWKL